MFTESGKRREHRYIALGKVALINGVVQSKHEAGLSRKCSICGSVTFLQHTGSGKEEGKEMKQGERKGEGSEEQTNLSQPHC